MGQTVIEINGVRYDATTGSIITESDSGVKHAPSTVHRLTGGNIDGIVSGPKPSSTPLKNPHFKPSLDRQVHDTSMVHKRYAAKSKTLMRAAVRKPTTHLDGVQPQSTKPTHHTPIQAAPSYKTASLIDARLGRAASTPTHSSVSKYNPLPTPKLQPTVTHLPVAAPASPPQQPQLASHAAPKPINHGSSDFIAAQLAKQPDTEQPRPKKKPLHKKLSSIFKGKKVRSIAATTTAGLLLGGFIAYQNMPSISLALANRTSGMSAKMPKGIPSNFAVSRRVDASKGQVTLVFSSRTDDREFSVTQQVSEMNSTELEKALALSHNKGFQTYDSNGIKLYIVGPGEADWIDGGIRVNISGKSGLSSEQLATIARSL
jgi:hypothetical protein